MNEERIKRIIECEAEADKHYQEEQEHYQEEQERRWEAARLIAEELAEGTSQRTLAKEIRKSQPHVWRCLKAWQKYGSDTLEYRPEWSKAYEEFQYHGKPGREQDQGKPDDDEPEPEYNSQQKNARTNSKKCSGCKKKLTYKEQEEYKAYSRRPFCSACLKEFIRTRTIQKVKHELSVWLTWLIRYDFPQESRDEIADELEHSAKVLRGLEEQ